MMEYAMPRKLLMIAGEASGDHHGAAVLRELRRLIPDLTVSGIGGDELVNAGLQPLYRSQDLSVVGLLEVLSRASHIVTAYRRVTSALRACPPDLVLLIDYPEFNLRIARRARACGLPVLYYISPQIWAWRRGRAKKIARCVDRMAVIFPFEKQLYADVGLPVEWVGHPLLDQEPPATDAAAARRALGLPDARPVIGLLPGSRPKEIEGLLPDMLGAAGIIAARCPDAQFILPIAAGLDTERLTTALRQCPVRVQAFTGRFYDVLDACDLALVASGTATLQAALREKPMVILYRVSPLTYAIGRRLIQVSWIGLANLVAGRQVVPELIQHAVTPARIAGEALAMLENPAQLRAVRDQLRAVRGALGGPGASRNVAHMAAGMLDRGRRH
jgi:lipid-A-disaccharide synthase